MDFKVLKRNHLKRKIIIGVISVLIISTIVLNFTRAKYRTTQSIPLVNGTINYSLADLNIVAIMVDGESVDTIPDGNYELTEESYCTVNGKEDSSISISYDSNTKNLTVTPFTTKGTKCYLDFVTVTTKRIDTILGKIEVNLDTPDFSKTAQADCNGKSNCEETNGIYEGQDDDGTTYYWRGAVDNNWVQWAGFYWRIIRINGDGTIRLIYNGTSATQTGTVTQLANESAFNSSNDNNMYVGFKYNSGNVHGTATNSTILTALNTWYTTSGIASHADDLDGNAGFCGDREPSTSSSSSNGQGGTGTTTTYYGAYIRLVTNKAPTFECENESDLYTTSGSEDGNRALTYPIGLITADEVAYAGGVVGTSNSSYYLYTGQYYWTMSPYRFYSSGYVSVFDVYSSGHLDNHRVNSEHGVRPVVNLKADITISSGNGTASNPYVIAT